MPFLGRRSGSGSSEIRMEGIITEIVGVGMNFPEEAIALWGVIIVNFCSPFFGIFTGQGYFSFDIRNSDTIGH